MRRAIFVVLLMVAGAAAAQIMVQPGVIQKPQPQVAMPQGPEAVALDPALSPETARAEIDRLKARVRDLRMQLSNTLANLQSARSELDEMQRAGGTLVRAQCVSQFLSRNTAGASEDCSASGYTCAAVSGLCHRSCTTSDMCAAGFTCDIPAGRCVVPAPASDE